MGHKVALSFEDGVTKVIKVGDYETVMDAAYKARINIPSDCRDGACGTCKAFCDSGSFDPGDFIDDAMTEEELEKGYLLTCQAVPESDLAIQIPATSESAKTAAASFTSTIKELNRHTDTTVSFTLEVDNRDALAFLPGQYVNLKVPGTDAERSYSFSSGPEVQDASFMVRVTPRAPCPSTSATAPPWVTPSTSPAPTDRSSCASPSGPCCSWPAAPAWPRSCPSWKSSPKTRPPPRST
ncbi:2Fe-2S iron-sulfur cluster-binding protein [Pseudarthrobacter sp. Fe7]|nr:2Fe-2S iron-sulfur cluster-binding protein [Pseudarthrobacter sp. Fe7]